MQVIPREKEAERVEAMSSNAKHNALHLVKLITFPIYIVMWVAALIEVLIRLCLEGCGFRLDSRVFCDFGLKIWEGLP